MEGDETGVDCSNTLQDVESTLQEMHAGFGIDSDDCAVSNQNDCLEENNFESGAELETAEDVEDVLEDSGELEQSQVTNDTAAVAEESEVVSEEDIDETAGTEPVHERHDSVHLTEVSEDVEFTDEVLQENYTVEHDEANIEEHLSEFSENVALENDITEEQTVEDEAGVYEVAEEGEMVIDDDPLVEDNQFSGEVDEGAHESAEFLSEDSEMPVEEEAVETVDEEDGLVVEDGTEEENTEINPHDMEEASVGENLETDQPSELAEEMEAEHDVDLKQEMAGSAVDEVVNDTNVVEGEDETEEVEETVAQEEDHPEEEDIALQGGGAEPEEESDEEQEENNQKENGVEDLETATPVLVRRNIYDVEDGKNYQNDILADWNEGGQTPAVNGCNEEDSLVPPDNDNKSAEIDEQNVETNETNDQSVEPAVTCDEIVEPAETCDKIAEPAEICDKIAEPAETCDKIAEPAEINDHSAETSESTTEVKTTVKKRERVLKRPRNHFVKYGVSSREAVSQIIKNSPPKGKPIVATGKDLFLSLELAKQAKKARVEAEQSKAIDKKRDELLEILEADDVEGWRQAVPPTELGKGSTDDLLIKSEINAPQTPTGNTQQTPLQRSTAKRKPTVTGTRGSNKKRAILTPNGERDREAERLLALHQLETQFPTRSRKPRGSVEVAVFDLERALSSTPVLAGHKRRPCYLPPEEIKKEPDLVVSHLPAVKTYTPKRRSLDTNNCEIETGLETIAVVNKHLNASKENNNSAVDSKEEPSPVKKKVKKLKKKLSDPQKRNRELQKLLADEGAVRMLYDAAHKDTTPEGRIPKKTKKELQKKTKFVQNAVMQLHSNEKTLRGKRVAVNSSPAEEASPSIEEPLFSKDTPVTAPAKSRKKARIAEASKILYRHSSSESFDGSEGMRRTVSEIAGLDKSPDRASVDRRSSITSEVTPLRKSSRPRKVNSKFSEWITDTLTVKGKKAEVAKPTIEPQEVETPQEVQEPPPPLEEQEIAAATTPKTPSATPTKSKKMKKKRPVQREREVKISESGSLLEISLTSVGPSIKNSFTPEVLIDLRKALEEAQTNAECKAVLLTSSGEVFCQGIDLSLLGPNYDVTRLLEEIKALVTTFATFSKPVIAGVQGPCVGLGVALLPLCDVVVASDKATFFTPYTRLCQSPEGGASVTFPRIGTGLVSELVYKCSKLTASDAARLGLVSQCIPNKAFSIGLKTAADAVCDQPLEALQSVKEMMTQPGRPAVLEGIARECEALHKSWTSPGCLEAVAAFVASGELLPNS